MANFLSRIKRPNFEKVLRVGAAPRERNMKDALGPTLESAFSPVSKIFKMLSNLPACGEWKRKWHQAQREYVKQHVRKEFVQFNQIRSLSDEDKKIIRKKHAPLILRAAKYDVILHMTLGSIEIVFFSLLLLLLYKHIGFFGEHVYQIVLAVQNRWPQKGVAPSSGLWNIGRLLLSSFVTLFACYRIFRLAVTHWCYADRGWGRITRLIILLLLFLATYWYYAPKFDNLHAVPLVIILAHTSVIGAGILLGITLAIYLLCYFLILLLLEFAVISLFAWQRSFRIPQVIVFSNLIQLLKLAEGRKLWETDLEVKRRACSLLEEVAVHFEHWMVKRLRHGDRTCNEQVSKRYKQIAAYLRSLKEHIHTPCKGSDQQFKRKIAEYLTTFSSGLLADLKIVQNVQDRQASTASAWVRPALISLLSFAALWGMNKFHFISVPFPWYIATLVPLFLKTSMSVSSADVERAKNLGSIFEVLQRFFSPKK